MPRTWVCLLVCVLVISATLAAPPKVKKFKTNSVYKKGLVVAKDLSGRNVLRHHDKMTTTASQVKNFPQATLGFVTPWNNHGYTIGKQMNAKFTYISPVWYQITPPQAGIDFQGQHDVDQGWMKEVRRMEGDTPAPLLVPRIHFASWSQESYILLGRENYVTRAIELITSECESKGFDGFVLDFSYLEFSAYHGNVMRFIKRLGTAMHKQQKQILLVVPPYHPKAKFFGAAEYEELYSSVDQFIVMTYDFSAGSRRETGGPSAPIPWMTQSVLSVVPPSGREKETKILLGLNFFGTTFCSEGSSPVIGSQYLELLETYQPTLQWNEEYQEHVFTYEHDELEWTCYYPTLKFIEDRLDLAKELNVGISIWETGQGLDYFYDLL